MNRVAATGLLALLLFVQGVKVFHNHNCFGAKAKSATYSVFNSNTEHRHPGLENGYTACSVCEYNFLKDANKEECYFPFQEPAVFCSYSQGIPYQPVTGPGYTLSLRGPPAI